MNNQDQLQKMIEIARKAHAGQFRFDGETPYIEHPLAVAAMFPESWVVHRTVSAGHDLFEDTDVTADYLRANGIDEVVIEAIEAMTKRPDEDYFNYLARVKVNPIARDVKIRDIIHNLGDSPTKTSVKKYSKALQFLLT